ncbi:MAG TPA: bifunctional phosphoglucose/phosphomannose isomerase [Flavobacteriales bacterium]|nr:bifunctional phosphoglucose/phosphomannose isomerase [Flavobacteriales bacterium]
MKQHVENFTQHLRTALDISGSSQITSTGQEIKNVLVLGMGGSGIGGSIAAQVLTDQLSVPVLSSKDYSIPAFVGENTLIIASSYSGNTEETLIALGKAEKKTKQIFCICSGGKIQEIANEKGYGCLVIPGGIPPRGAFGYSFPQLFKLLAINDLIDRDISSKFTSAIALIDEKEDAVKKEAFEIASRLHNKRIIIYAQSDYEGVCIRFRQQINENSKMLCWHHVIPEMNHNELVGWREKSDKLAVVMLRNHDDFERNQSRMELCKSVMGKYCSNINEIWSEGHNKLERTLYLVHLCDWISIYIAELNGTDPVEIEVINYLKGELSKIR